MSSDVVLSAALRANLLSLQSTQKSIDGTQLRLSTGKKVNSALDNPQSFFAAQALTNRASDLTKLLDGIGQSIQVIKAADNGVTALTSLINQAQATATSAQDAIATGSTTAKVTGSVTLDGTAKVSSLTGFNASGDKLLITITDASGTKLFDGTATHGLVTTQTNQTISGLVQAINDLNTTNTTVAGASVASTPIVKASLDSTGHLQIEALNGGTLHIQFQDSASTASGVPSQTQATSLGFGAIGKLNQIGSTGAATFDLTAAATATLNSIALYSTGPTTLAQATTLLTALKDSTNTSITTLASADTLKLTIGGKQSGDLLHYNGANGTTATVQTLIDGINNDATIKSLVSASFDATTGKISIKALDASATDVQFNFASAANDKISLGFGTTTLAIGSASATGQANEDVRFGAAAGTIASLQTQYNNTLAQIDALVTNGDTGYRGTNLLNGNNLVTTFNEGRTSTLTTTGVTFSSSGLGLKAANFSNAASISSNLSQVSAALTSVRSFGSSLANDLSTIQARQDFTTNLINTLNTGADALTNSDQNEEGAKLLALQTRQSLGVTALSLASQSQQSILRLFG